MEEVFSAHVVGQLSKQSPTPLYHQLFSLLKSRILDGTLAYGTRLPPEERLADIFSVSRITAKRAMDDLSKDALVERRRGRGTHVIYQYSPRPVQAPLTGMLQEIESMARNSVAQILDFGIRIPPQKIREDLRLAEGETVLHLLRVRERDGMKFGHYTSWTAGVKMPADPAIFENPEEFNILRKNADKHLAFGIGRHTCLGKPVALMQLQEFYSQFLTRFQDFEMDGEWKVAPNNFVHAIQEMPIKFSPK